VSRLVPKDASFAYVANSTIIARLTELGVDLRIFYEYLWKHILCIHIIRECLGVKTDDQFGAMLTRFKSFISTRDKKKRVVVEYLTRHQRQFWIEADEISREETFAIRDQLAAALKLSAADLEAKLENVTEESEQMRRTIKQRAQNVVSELQMRQLNETVEALADLLAERKYQYMVLIDDLDDDSTSEHTQYPLIRGLIASLKTFKRIENLKVIVALREDLFEAMLRATLDRHFQPEKLAGMLARIRWSPDQLHRVVERRLNHLFAQRYTRQGVGIEDVLPAKIKSEPIRSYLVTRTLRRPRDIIAFVNRILNVGGQGVEVPISARVVTQAETAYARDRKDALEYEWRSCHSLVRNYLDVLTDGPSINALSELDEERLTPLVLVAAGVQAHDDVVRLAHEACEPNNEGQFKRLAAALVACLFKTGAIGVKLRPTDPYRHCYEDSATIDPSELGDRTKISVHPMLKPVLGGNASVEAA
jgi:hypothetical protein